MKKIYFYTKGAVLFLLLVTLAGSCKKSFLEVSPKGVLIAKATADYQGLLGNVDLLYASFSNLANVAMGDEMAAVEEYFSIAVPRVQRLFRWDDVVYDPRQDADEFAGLVKTLYYYNKIINEVDNSTGGSEQEKRSVKAQAMASRAWTYFMLINFYGKPYDPATAATDPGFPIITTADATQKSFTRASVKEVYDLIVKDLTTAIPDLPIGINHRLRMCKAAGEGLLGKVYMFMGRFSDALPPLNASIADLPTGAGTIPFVLYNYNSTFGPSGSFLPVTENGPTYPGFVDNQETLFARYAMFNYYDNELVADKKTVDLYQSSDWRLQFFSSMPYPSGPDYPAGLLRRAGPSINSIGVALPDLYLLQAECKARLNDLPGATANVKAFREKRMPPADAPVPASVTDKASLVKFILEERIREFAVSGYRWFDMRRLSVDPDYKSTIDLTHRLYSPTGTVSATYTLKPARLTMRFPQKLMDQNPGMQNNP